jgi:tRNA C32,U32 (ribose-2'-O)-methylase TrmJ
MEKKKRRAAAAKARLEKVAVVLFKPRLPENIGAAARAMCNMGLSRLVVVQPEILDRQRMAMMATGTAEYLLDKMAVHDGLAEALAPFEQLKGAMPLDAKGLRAWTDDYSDIIGPFLSKLSD